jgi:hypothetical protein
MSAARWVKITCNNCRHVIEKLDDGRVLEGWGQIVMPDTMATIDLCATCLALDSLGWASFIPGIRIGIR